LGSGVEDVVKEGLFKSFSNFIQVLGYFADGELGIVNGGEAGLARGGVARDIGNAPWEERGRLVFELDIGNEGWVDHFVDRLGLSAGLELELLLVWETIHGWRSSVGIVGDKVPASADVRLFVVAAFSEEARRGGSAALG